jgi:hypothetical protein
MDLSLILELCDGGWSGIEENRYDRLPSITPMVPSV